MPRKPASPAAPAEPTAEDRTARILALVASAIDARPFDPDAAPDAPHLFANLVCTDEDATYLGVPAPDASEMLRAGIATRIAKDRAAGLSGNDLRGKYAGPSESHAKGRGLTGPRRREVLRKYGYGSLVARSYVAYTDGEARTGSAHARMHGARAADRAAADAALVVAAEQAAKEESIAATVAGTDLRTMRTALREAGAKVPRVSGGDETALRAAYAEMLRAS